MKIDKFKLSVFIKKLTQYNPVHCWSLPASPMHWNGCIFTIPREHKVLIKQRGKRLPESHFMN